MIERVVYAVMILGLASVSIQTWMIAETISEMNARQKNVVVAQHKAIEDKIAEVCGGAKKQAGPSMMRDCVLGMDLATKKLITAPCSHGIGAVTSEGP
jgi:hypothetical protein